MLSKERIESFDFIKFIAILLVVWGHGIGYFIPGDHSMNWAYTIIYSFHMPLFMMVTGFFGANLYKRSFREMISKKFVQLLLPVLSFGLLLSLYHAVILKDGVRFLYGFYNFWFLPSAFMCAVMFYLATKIRKYRAVGVVTMLLISQLLPVISNHVPMIVMQFMPDMDLQRMFPCYVAGAFINSWYYEFQKNRRIIFIVSTVVYLLIYLSLMSPVRISFDQGYSYLFGLVRLVGGIAASISLISLVELCYGVIKKIAHYNWTCKVGRKTLGVYIIHSLILEEIMVGLFMIDTGNEFVDSWIICIVLSLMIMGVCYGVIRLIEQSRLLSYLMLGKGSLKKESQAAVVED